MAHTRKKQLEKPESTYDDIPNKYKKNCKSNDFFLYDSGYNDPNRIIFFGVKKSFITDRV